MADLDGDGGKELVGRDSSGLMAYKYDGESGSWTQLATLTAVSDDGFSYTYMEAPYLYEAAVASLGYGNVIGGRSDTTEEVVMLTDDQGLAVFSYDPASDSWTTYADDSGFFADLNVWGNGQYYDSIQLYDAAGNGHMSLAARGTDGLGLYRFLGDGWNLDETLDYFSDDNGWKHGNYSRTVTMTDVNGDGIADATGWHGGGVEALINAGSDWTQMETLGLSEDLGWQGCPVRFHHPVGRTGRRHHKRQRNADPGLQRGQDLRLRQHGRGAHRFPRCLSRLYRS